jgi:hypothetical protein
VSRGGSGTGAAATLACEEVRTRWDGIQVGFVDEPRSVAQEKVALVSATFKWLAENFAAERQKLEQLWDLSENASTEELRVALQRYRSFFCPTSRDLNAP